MQRFGWLIVLFLVILSFGTAKASHFNLGALKSCKFSMVLQSESLGEQELQFHPDRPLASELLKIEHYLAENVQAFLLLNELIMHVKYQASVMRGKNEFTQLKIGIDAQKTRYLLVLGEVLVDSVEKMQPKAWVKVNQLHSTYGRQSIFLMYAYLYVRESAGREDLLHRPSAHLKGRSAEVARRAAEAMLTKVGLLKSADNDLGVMNVTAEPSIDFQHLPPVYKQARQFSEGMMQAIPMSFGVGFISELKEMYRLDREFEN